MEKFKELSQTEYQQLIKTLKARFEKNMHRHKNFEWAKIQEKLDPVSAKQKLWSLHEMEKTGGEPDVVAIATEPGKYTFIDCATESPKGRRSLCYDREALESRKEHKPKNSVLDMAKEMGIELLTEQLYRELQKLEPFDAKTSSWIVTPEAIRTLGGSLFADFRYGKVFVYHNGASSYYAARGFRAYLNL